MKRVVPAARRSLSLATRPLLEQVEARLLLCGTHDPALLTAAGAPAFWGTKVPQTTVVAYPAGAPLAPLAPAPATTPITAAITLANGMPVLNSRAAAPTAIYLDFDGDTTTNRTPYDEDGNPSTFNAAEQASITEAWRQMSAYYAMFDLNVTTVMPSVPRAWISIANNHSGVGYSYVNVFPNSRPESFNPSGDARGRVSGLAHEVGHNFGLGHQSAYDVWGTKTAEYIGAADWLHGPLMGVDYSGTVHKWTWGHPSSGVTDLQDDIAVVASKIKPHQPAGGDGFRPDDYTNTIATATPLPAHSGGYGVDAIIERMTDRDAFSFVVTGTGALTAISAAPDAPSGLDAKLEIYDATGKLLAAADSNTVNHQSLNLDLAPGTYYVVVSSHGDYGDLGAYHLAVDELPAGWTAIDVGNSGTGGYTAYDAATGTFTNAGSGADVFNADDQFHFTYQTLTGDGSITARVTHVDPTDPWAKVGLDIRDALTNNSRHVGVFATGSNGPQLVWRTSTGGNSGSSNTSGGAFTTVWLRLTRTGNTFRGYSSPDGVNWTQVGSSMTVTMNAKAYVGLLTTAHNNVRLNVATLDNVSLTGNTAVAPPVYNALPSPTNLAVTPGTGTGLNASWDPVPGATGYRLERSQDGVNFVTAANVTGGAATTFNDNNLFGSVRWFYRVAAVDPAGASAPSAPASAVNRPGAPAGATLISVNTSTIVVDWKDVDGETGYRIERSTDGTNFSLVTTVAANRPSYTNTGLATATRYTYRITPLSALGDGLPVTTTTGGTRLAAVPGMAFDNITPTQVTFHWTDIAGETNYRVERSTNGTDWTTLTSSLPANQTVYTAAGLSPLTQYYFRVVGTANGMMSVFPAPLMVGTPANAPAATLPPGWNAADVGVAPHAGTSAYSGGTFTVISTGGDIWGAADEFRYTYRTLTGNGQIVARVASLEDVDGWTKIGVMIRASTAANAQQASLFITPDNGASMQYRTTTGGQSNSISGPNVDAPYWVKLTRSGNTITTFASPDGNAWTQVGSANISMPTNVLIGLAATSHDDARLNTATFTNVIVSPPVVLSTAFNFRDKISVQFGSNVQASLQPGDLVVQALDGSGPVYTPTAVSWDANTNTATFTFASPFPDGDYRSTLVAGSVSDTQNSPLAVSSVYTFFALAGDANRDRATDFNDMVILAQNYATSGKTWATGDFTGDGAVDFNDLVYLAQNYNKSLAAPAPVAPAPALATTTTRPRPAPAPPPTPTVAAPFALQRVRVDTDVDSLLA